jgi:hypothetical protein
VLHETVQAEQAAQRGEDDVLEQGRLAPLLRGGAHPRNALQ